MLDLNAELANLDTTILPHRLAAIITSMPGFGSLLSTELLAATTAT